MKSVEKQSQVQQAMEEDNAVQVALSPHLSDTLHSSRAACCFLLSPSWPPPAAVAAEPALRLLPAPSLPSCSFPKAT